MNKISLKFIITGALILAIFFSLLFISNVEAQAQPQLLISTTGYTALNENNFLFYGSFSGNTVKKPFTTYFEFKKDNSNFNTDAETTVKIIRKDNIDEFGDFETSPELKMFSTYYFRTVGYFNDNESHKFYGGVISLRTGQIPQGATYPYRVRQDGVVVPYVPTPPNCKSTENLVNGVCVGKTTTPGTPPTCTSSQVLMGGICVARAMCTSPKVLNTSTNTCVNPMSDLPPIIYDDSSSSGSAEPTGPTGLVPCVNNCGFSDIFKLINTIVNFILFVLAVPLSAIMFAYAGFLMLVPGGESASKKTKGKEIFMHVAVGLLLVAGAWTIVHTFLIVVGYNDTSEWLWFGLN